jgi:hypothetical protein
MLATSSVGERRPPLRASVVSEPTAADSTVLSILLLPAYLGSSVSVRDEWEVNSRGLGLTEKSSLVPPDAYRIASVAHAAIIGASQAPGIILGRAFAFPAWPAN